ncbi:MAG: hypothetical protein R6V05_04095 [Candidatus Brocadiia bacterium]
MSTEQANNGVSSGQFDTLMRRIDELEETIEDQKDVIGTQGDQIEALESLLQIRSDDDDSATLEDIWIANQPIGLILEKANKRSKDNKKQLDGVETAATDGGSQLRTLGEEVRNRMLPIHKMWVDVRDGRAEQLGKNDRRAARLFGKFIRRASGNPEPSVDPSYNTYSMDSASAADVLENAEDTKSAGTPMTVKRAMEAVERYSKVADEAVVEFTKNKGKNTLAVDKEKFNAIMHNVEAAIEGSLDGDTDDTGANPVEDTTDEIGKEFNRLSGGQQ